MQMTHIPRLSQLPFDAITCFFVPFRLAFYANVTLYLFKLMCAFLKTDVLVRDAGMSLKSVVFDDARGTSRN